MLFYCEKCGVFHDGRHTCKKSNKYNAVSQLVNGERFDSRKEEQRWRDLQRLERAGKIRDLQRQVTYLLEVNGSLIGKYIADHQYIENERTIVEDVKSKATRTPTYRLKKKLMKAIHGIDILEV